MKVASTSKLEIGVHPPRTLYLRLTSLTVSVTHCVASSVSRLLRSHSGLKLSKQHVIACRIFSFESKVHLSPPSSCQCAYQPSAVNTTAVHAAQLACESTLVI